MLKRLWERWKKIAHAIGNFQARLLLTLLYAVLVLPFGLIVRLFADPLRIRRLPSQWLSRNDDDSAPTLDWATRYW
ncbi:MAG: hypothetical protein HYR58_07300 [Acidobacteria bacterium]|nr:hypothetical protein [Acidobacteriota bacterium]MBI3484287.1 hypothetical protein [Acidobacteriota bacterium]